MSSRTQSNSALPPRLPSGSDSNLEFARSTNRQSSGDRHADRSRSLTRSHSSRSREASLVSDSHIMSSRSRGRSRSSGRRDEYVRGRSRSSVGQGHTFEPSSSGYEPRRRHRSSSRSSREANGEELQLYHDQFKPRRRSRSSSRGRRNNPGEHATNRSRRDTTKGMNSFDQDQRQLDRSYSYGDISTRILSQKREQGSWAGEDTCRHEEHNVVDNGTRRSVTEWDRNVAAREDIKHSGSSYRSNNLVVTTTDIGGEERYDFSPVKNTPPSVVSNGPIDPWAYDEKPPSPEGGHHPLGEDYVISFRNQSIRDEEDASGSRPSKTATIETFLTGTDIHPNMIQSEEDISQLRLLAGKLSADWGGNNLMAPALARRIRDFQYAQDKRRKKYGDERPWGILGLYDHLSGIRVDVEWAEDAAWRRSNGEPYLSWSDFEASKKKGINRPFFTYFILFACTIIMVVSIGLNGWKVEPFDVNPMIGPSAETLIKMGAKDSYLIVHAHESWRLVSSIVLHAGLIHFFVNMLALWFVGAAIETSHGFIATTMVFIIPAVGGTIMSAIFLPQYITVGASGGIFGLIGACLADILVNWKLLFNDFVTENGKKHHHALVLVFLILDIIINCLIGLTPYVDNFTHLGGMAYGFLCGISTMERVSSDFFGLSEGIWRKTKHIIVRFFGLIVSLIVIVVTLVILLEGDGKTTPCTSCTWLSCVPFPPWEGETEKWWYCDDCGRVTAEIVSKPEVHLELNCPSGNRVDVPLDENDSGDTSQLEKALPSYCREFCVDTNGSL